MKPNVISWGMAAAMSLLCGQAVAEPEWWYLSKDDGTPRTAAMADGTSSVYFLDRNSIRRQGNELEFWQQVRLTKTMEREGIRLAAAMRRYALDCAARTLRLTYETGYGPDGRELSSSDQQSTNPVIPGSLGEHAAGFVCGHPKLTTQKKYATQVRAGETPETVTNRLRQ